LFLTYRTELAASVFEKSCRKGLEIGSKNKTEKRLLCQSPHSAGLKKKKPLISQGLKLAGGNGGIRTLDEALHPILP
jgi:hypothetical protein